MSSTRPPRTELDDRNVRATATARRTHLPSIADLTMKGCHHPMSRASFDPSTLFSSLQRPHDPQRRHVTFGLAASLITLAWPENARAAQAPEIPSFSSGRFQFTIVEPRQTIPSLILFPLKGRALDLASLRGRPVLLNFWATWCAACRMEMPILDRLQQTHRSTELEIIAVSEDRASRAVVERWRSTMPATESMPPSGSTACRLPTRSRHPDGSSDTCPAQPIGPRRPRAI
jgi:thiol-disulfide isomerase/thioredoxin